LLRKPSAEKWTPREKIKRERRSKAFCGGQQEARQGRAFTIQQNIKKRIPSDTTNRGRKK